MKYKKTVRGFDLYTFEDLLGKKCSLQKSSLATKDAIWIGWQEIKLAGDYVANTRMELSQEMVLKLIPILQRFVETGEIHP